VGPPSCAPGRSLSFAFRADRRGLLSLALQRLLNFLVDPLADRPCGRRPGHAQARLWITYFRQASPYSAEGRARYFGAPDCPDLPRVSPAESLERRVPPEFNQAMMNTLRNGTDPSWCNRC
jgi:hypothetical protein